MNSLRICSLVALLIVVTGCSTPNFVRPTKDSLTLGKSTREDIIRLVGKPTAQNDNIQINSEKVQTLTYYHGDNARLGFVTKERTLIYTLFNSVLVGEEFISTYSEEDTNFDSSKVPAIEKGKSSRNDVISLLGKPSGELLYPVINAKNGSGLVYDYSTVRFAGVAGAIKTSDLLIVTLNEHNIVSNVSYRKNGVEQVQH